MGQPLDTVVHAASLAEVAWVEGSGGPRAAGVVPLVRGGRPVLAIAFDRTGLARSLAAADVVDLVLREPRNTGAGWQPAGWRCESTLEADPEGEVFAEELLLQELRRYPPARRYADSPLLIREHWWYLPRLIIELEPVADLPPPRPRSGPGDLLLVTATEGGPVTSGLQVADGPPAHHWGPAPADGAGIVHDQDATFPDLERWDTRSLPVEVAGGRLRPDDSLTSLAARAPVARPGLLDRWRAERRFASRCRSGLAAWRS